MITEPPPTTTLAIRVTPRAKRDLVRCDPGGTVKVYVTVPPEDGRANAAVVELLADWLGLKRRQVRIAQGATNRNKLAAIDGLTAAQLERIIREHA